MANKPGRPVTTQGEKISIYIPRELIDSLKEESRRLDRSVSWVLQQAWKIAKDKIIAFRSTDEALSK